MIGHVLAGQGRIYVITAVFLGYNRIEKVEHLSGDGSRTFIDIIHEVNPYRTSRTGDQLVDFGSNLRISRSGIGQPSARDLHDECLRHFYWICGPNPVSEISGNLVLLSPNIVPTVRWGSADRWKCQYHGWVAAAKVLGPYQRVGFRQIKGVCF